MFSVMLITGAVGLEFGLVPAEAPAGVDASKLAKFNEFYLPRVTQKECDDKVREKRKELNLPGSGPNRVSDLKVWKPEYYMVNGRPVKLTGSGYGECRRLTKDNCEKMRGPFSDGAILNCGCTFKTPDPNDSPKPFTFGEQVKTVIKYVFWIYIASFWFDLFRFCLCDTSVDEPTPRKPRKRRKPRKPRDDDDDPSISDDDVDSKKHGGGGDDDVINEQEDPSFWDRITDSSSSIFIPFWVIVGLLVLGLIGGCVACIMCATKDSEDEYDLEYGPRARSRSRRSRSGRSRTPSGYSRSRKPSGFSRTPGFTPGRSRRASGKSRTPGRTPSGMSRMTPSRAPSGHSLSRWKSSRIRRSSRI